MIVEIPRASFYNLLLRPAPWHLLNMKKKNHYTKIHAWLLKNEKGNDLDRSCNRLKPREDELDAINTTHVASGLVQLLKSNGITQGYFATQKLKILTVFFEQLVNKPKPYADLKESEKKIFKCMKKWTDPSEIRTLKRDYDAHVAAKQKLYFEKKNQLK
jgi:hypothetical protein